MNCPICNKKIALSTMFCKHCGFEIHILPEGVDDAIIAYEQERIEKYKERMRLITAGTKADELSEQLAAATKRAVAAEEKVAEQIKEIQKMQIENGELQKQIEASPIIIQQHAEVYKKITERNILEPEKEISLAQINGVSIVRAGQVIKIEWKWESLQMVHITYNFDGKEDKQMPIYRHQHPEPQYQINVSEEVRTVRVNIRPCVETSKGGELYGSPCEEVIIMRPTTVRFISVINKKKHLVLPTDDYILQIQCDALLPCDLHLLITEGAPAIDLESYTPDEVIKQKQIIPNNNTEMTFTYYRKKKGQPIFFRLIAADPDKRQQVIVVPESLSI